MVDTAHIRGIIEKALENARAADLDVPQQIEHAVRALLQMHPELSQQDAITAVRRVMRPY